jgi:hypothetical protein
MGASLALGSSIALPILSRFSASASRSDTPAAVGENTLLQVDAALQDQRRIHLEALREVKRQVVPPYLHLLALADLVERALDGGAGGVVEVTLGLGTGFMT